jgi:molybdenum cofactor cytidylyltransferase
MGSDSETQPGGVTLGGTAALVLSAGASSRLEGLPKALLSVGTETAIRRTVRISREVGCPTVAVVVGAHAAEIRRELHDERVLWVDHPDWELGRTGSIQAGLGPLLELERDLLLWPVDHPFVDAKSVLSLAERAERDTMGLWFIPTFNGHGGHPVLLRKPVLPKILHLRPDAPLRSLLPEFGPQVVRVPVEDPGVTEKVTTMDSYRGALVQWQGRGGGLA